MWSTMLLTMDVRKSFDKQFGHRSGGPENHVAGGNSHSTSEIAPPSPNAIAKVRMYALWPPIP